MNLQIESKNYALNVDQAIKLGILQEIKPSYVAPKEYAIGQRFTSSEHGNPEYLLAASGKDMVALIVLETGNRWMDAVKVNDCHHITEAEFRLISLCSQFNVVTFKRIK